VNIVQKLPNISTLQIAIDGRIDQILCNLLMKLRDSLVDFTNNNHYYSDDDDSYNFDDFEDFYQSYQPPYNNDKFKTEINFF